MTRTGRAPAHGRLLDAFARDVAEYLERVPAQLPSKYLYDALGSALFDAICRLPWYCITRAESGLLALHGRDVLSRFQEGLTITELGCGNGDKLALLLERAGERCRHVELVDISPDALAAAHDRIDSFPLESIVARQGTYEHGFALAARERHEGPMLVLFLGSNIGNFDPPAADALLLAIRQGLSAGDALLLGTDLVKPDADLVRAYDDPLKVTAAFNLNLLRRINDELGGTFDLAAFEHRAVWNAGDARVEMHLVSRTRQAVRIAAAGFERTFEPDEWIWTESSYKYEPKHIIEHGLAAGFTAGRHWIDEDARFALTLFTV